MGWALVLSACAGASAGPRDAGPSPDGGPPPDAGATGTAARAWYQFGFQDPVLDSVALFYLGEAWQQSTDVGEVLETLGRVDETDPTSWTREWRKTAERLEAVARQSEQAGHAISACQAYLRASSYYRAALHHHTDPTSAEVPLLAQREVDEFQKFLTLSRSPCSAVRMPYDGTTLPGYFCVSSAAPAAAPVLLFQEGRDGWAEDGRYIADEAMKRGYHVLLFDGPGMGQVLRLQGLPFRPDWEHVVGAVVDYVATRPEVDASRIGLMSISMGGYLGPQAATKEHRLKVLVANPGVVDWGAIYRAFLDQIDPTLLPLVDADPAAFDARLAQLMAGSELLHWGLVDSMWHQGVTTPSALMKDVRRYALGAGVANITAHTLVVDAEAEEWGQSRLLYDALTAPKDLLTFTAAEAAQFHVQPAAAGIATIRLLDWLDGAL
jgi:Prolyl oligopeptidase family